MMKASTTSALAAVLACAATSVRAAPYGSAPDTTYPYKGPAIPIGDWVDQNVNGNGRGFPRLVEPPAVRPASANPTNNINVIKLAYAAGGMTVHFSTTFGIAGAPAIKFGSDPKNLDRTITGYTHSYGRTPPCSAYDAVTQCSEFHHDITITDLAPGTVYYYQVPGGNGTTPSDVLSFTTAREAGQDGSFTVACINDMGYTNAGGTYRQLLKAVSDGAAFAWHGGDISYADDWYSGILPCESDWPVCYNGSHTALPGNLTIPDEYLAPLPAGEVPNQGGPQGGDMSVIYESNLDLWDQWMNSITMRIPYMVNPGNHEAACAEFDGPNNELSALLDHGIVNGTEPNSTLTYFSCPPSQRNFTAFQHHWRMPGFEDGRTNFWYSFDFGLAHFVSFDGETDYYQSPEYPFVADLKGNETYPKEDETYITDAGPFGYINGSYKINENYEQVQWLKQDLAAVDRTKTPWVFAMSHRPMYSSQTSSYQAHMRNAFEKIFLDAGVDAYLAGHIHWYERMKPMGLNGTIQSSFAIDNHTNIAGKGAITHIVNGQAGNIESHSELSATQPILNLTQVLDRVNYGFTRLTVENATVAKFEFIKGSDGSVGDYVTLVKQ